MRIVKLFQNLLDEKVWEKVPLGHGIWRTLTFLKVLMDKIKQDDCQGLAEEMAYSFILTIIPTLIFLFSLFGMLAKGSAFLPIAFNLIQRLAPPQTIQLFQIILVGVLQHSSGQITFIGLVVALWSATGGASVVIKGLSRAYGPLKKSQAFWYSPLMSIIIIAFLGIMMVVASNLIIFGDAIVQLFRGYWQLPWHSLFLLNLGRWAMVVLGSAFLGAFVYSLLLRPYRQKFVWKNAILGAMVFVSLWVIISLLFSTYVTKLNRFNPIYGTMGALVLLLTWLYLTSLSILIGGEVTAILEFLPSENPKA